MNLCRFLQSRWGRKTRWQANVHQSQQARSSCHVFLVWRGKWGGAEIKPHTYREETLHINLHTCYMVGLPVQSQTCMSDSKEMTVWGLRSVNHRDVDNGSEDRSVNCPAGKGGRRNEIYASGKRGQWLGLGLVWTNPFTHLAMFPAAATMEFCVMVATRLIPWPSAPRSYT